MDAQFYFNRGVERSKNNDLLGAIEDYSAAIILTSSRTKKTISNKQPDGSITHVDVIEESEGDVNTYFNRGDAYFKLGKYGEAYEDYSKIILYNQQDAEVYFKRAIVNYCLENDVESNEDLATAFKLDPKYDRELFLNQFQR